MKKIAITVPKQSGNSDIPKHNINSQYIKYIRACGYAPIPLFEEDIKEEVIQELDNVLSVCDGVLLPGGIDIEPTYYGENNVASFECSPSLDAFDRTVMHMAMHKGLPIFGICRGFQLIARQYIVCNNGELFYRQNIDRHNQTSTVRAKRNVPSHRVYANIAKIYGVDMDNAQSGWDFMFVNSLHHQGVVCTDLKSLKKASSNLRLLALTSYGLPVTKGKKEKTQLVEAFSINNFNGNNTSGVGSEIMAVQWHPEELMDTSLMTHFFDNASINRRDKIDIKNKKAVMETLSI